MLAGAQFYDVLQTTGFRGNMRNCFGVDSNDFQWLPLNFDYSAAASAEVSPRDGGII